MVQFYSEAFAIPKLQQLVGVLAFPPAFGYVPWDTIF
jgi:hypothetical protein